MLSIIYPYRNRNLQGVKRSLDSLRSQTKPTFEVFFIDYGSSPETAFQVKELCAKYSFINYRYAFNQHQPWNKSRALNSVIKTLVSGYCFVADVDIIFHPEFIQKAIQLQDLNKSTYFQVGFLSEGDEVTQNHFTTGDYRKSTREATGLSMFPVRVLQDLRGFDEFYHFWGAEDTDMHVRIENAGYEVKFYDKEILLLHQWHPSYRREERKTLTRELQINGIVQLNHQHLQWAIQKNTTATNREEWGVVTSKEDFEFLDQLKTDQCIDNEKRKIDDLLYGQFPSFKNRAVKIEIKKSLYQRSLKYKLKRILRKKVPEYYTLKEVNDLVLLHLISFYRTRPYIYMVDDNLDSLTLSIKL
ncbi:glycosyltransferase [Salinimicrobium sp. MT39]|uniref:Glycosyltransferase n=1 Tax=Salinimicrobium profundisediminis TaxID=2994553 RepID=A0A9X3CV87_9FLAO|nr:glycosyltransferase [Salinimicrobium profundisediminis]MCX2837497.1 glycosyltransferase [Salinimicrobium profundisediminis]